MVQLGVQHNFIWKWIGVACHNWGDMVFLFVDSGHNFERCFPQHLLHSFADFDALYTTLVSDWPTCVSELRHLPDSVLGTAIVILIVQVSQHTCSSFFPPNHSPDFLLFFSKKCTATRPRTPPLDDEERCCCINVLTRESM